MRWARGALGALEGVGLAEAHVDHGGDAVRGEGGDVVEAADDLGVGAVPGTVEHLRRDDRGLGGDTDPACAVVGRRRDAGDVGAVALVVLGDGARRDAVDRVAEVEMGHQVGVVGVDAGVEDSDPHPGAVCGAAPVPVLVREVAVDAEHAHRRPLGRGVATRRVDTEHVRVLLQRLCGLGGPAEGEPVEDVLVHVGDLHARLGSQWLGGRPSRLPGRHGDDPRRVAGTGDEATVGEAEPRGRNGAVGNERVGLGGDGGGDRREEDEGGGRGDEASGATAGVLRRGGGAHHRAWLLSNADCHPMTATESGQWGGGPTTAPSIASAPLGCGRSGLPIARSA